MKPDEAYSLLVDANPVPDPAAYVDEILAGSDGPALLERRREDMQTIDRSTTTAGKPRRPWVAVAAGILMLVAVGAILLVNSDDPEVATELTDAELAVDRAEQFLAAEDVAGLAEAVGSDPMPADELLMWEWTLVLRDAGYFGDFGACRAVNESGVIRVECEFSWQDPVADILGIEVTTQPFDFFPELGESGQLDWLSFGPGDPSRVNQAYAEYLEQFEPELYESFCSPSAYELGAVVSSRGLAFTPQCAEAVAPHIPSVVDWVESGQPDQ